MFEILSDLHEDKIGEIVREGERQVLPEIDDLNMNFSHKIVRSVENDENIHVDEVISEKSFEDVFLEAAKDGLTMNELKTIYPNVTQSALNRKLYDARKNGRIMSTKNRRMIGDSYTGTRIYLHTDFAHAGTEHEPNTRHNDLRTRLSFAIYESGETGISSLQLRQIFPTVKTHSLHPSLTRLSKMGAIARDDDRIYRWIGSPPKEKVEKPPRKPTRVKLILDFMRKHNINEGLDGWTIAKYLDGYGYNIIHTYTTLTAMSSHDGKIVHCNGKYFIKEADKKIPPIRKVSTLDVYIQDFLHGLTHRENGITNAEVIEESKKNLNFISANVTLRTMIGRGAIEYRDKSFFWVDENVSTNE